MNPKVKCPQCQCEIDVNELFAKQVIEAHEIQLKNALETKEKEFQIKVDSFEKKILEARVNYKNCLIKDREKISAEVNEKIKRDYESIISALKKEVDEKSDIIVKTKMDEIALLKQKKELEEKQQALELDVLKRVEEERQRIKNDAIQKTEEMHRFKELESKKTIADLEKTISELNIKISKSSQQLQGEVAELEIESSLQSHFTHDSIIPVPKGVKGADAIETVVSPIGVKSGKIIIESKRTKAWSATWIKKLKTDQQEANADIALIVSNKLPDGIKKFGCIDGVWVADFSCYIELVAVLRLQLLEMHRIRSTLIGKESKMGELYKYVCSQEYTQKVLSITRTLLDMKNNLMTEKNAINKIWAVRDKQLENVINTSMAITGSIDYILGHNVNNELNKIAEATSTSLVEGGKHEPF
jgi:hypothetical protein